MSVPGRSISIRTLTPRTLSLPCVRARTHAHAPFRRTNEHRRVAHRRDDRHACAYVDHAHLVDDSKKKVVLGVAQEVHLHRRTHGRAPSRTAKRTAAETASIRQRASERHWTECTATRRRCARSSREPDVPLTAPVGLVGACRLRRLLVGSPASTAQQCFATSSLAAVDRLVA